jgi:hypothetical protein
MQDYIDIHKKKQTLISNTQYEVLIAEDLKNGSLPDLYSHITLLRMDYSHGLFEVEQKEHMNLNNQPIDWELIPHPATDTDRHGGEKRIAWMKVIVTCKNEKKEIQIYVKLRANDQERSD